MKKAYAWRLAVLSTSVWASMAFAQTHQSQDFKEFYQQFHQNPAQVMDQLPPKEGTAVQFFSEEAKQDSSFVESKDQNRSRVLQIQGRAGFQYNDRAENLVDNGESIVKSLVEMQKQGLLEAKLEETPWSDDYWAISKGILAARYGDPDKNDTHDWKENLEFNTSNPISDYIQNGNIDLLSPAEKYDLLMGDANQTLTKKMWSEGKSYYDTYGKVETWMGICHGWAPAAYMLERPTKAIKVKDVTGEHEITFFPSDIKALGSLLWANGQSETKFVGGRCNDKEPKKDRVTGRILSNECFDTNPGTWHLAVVNQLGVAKRSFVIDATFDYEVWNHPMYSYSYRYFNVETGETTKELDKAVIDLKDFSKDKFKSFRDAKTKKVVGVEMRIQYVVETHPTQRTTDNSRYDALNSATYRYDLELDSKGNIIGGEWYSNAHPDFLWTPPVGGKVKSSVDRYMSGATLKDVVKKGARFAPNSSASGLPLPKVVEGLINKSRE